MALPNEMKMKIFLLQSCKCCINADCIITADARLGSQEECRLERTLSFFDRVDSGAK